MPKLIHSYMMHVLFGVHFHSFAHNELQSILRNPIIFWRQKFPHSIARLLGHLHDVKIGANFPSSTLIRTYTAIRKTRVFTRVSSIVTIASTITSIASTVTPTITITTMHSRARGKWTPISWQSPWCHRSKGNRWFSKVGLESKGEHAIPECTCTFWPAFR